MKKISILVFIFGVLISSSPSYAGVGYTDGNQMLFACNELSKLLRLHIELDSFEAGKCWGYISASTDIHKAMRSGSSPIVCIPEDKEVSDYVTIVIKYLNEHPQDLDHKAFELVTKAFAEVFPCP